jgi:hypothetical protein
MAHTATFFMFMLFFNPAYAIDEKLKPAQEKSKELILDFDVFTKESIVRIGGERYRRVEYRNKVFYMQIDSGEGKELHVLCDLKGTQAGPSQVEIAVRVHKRSSLFVKGLNQVCEEVHGGQHKVHLSPGDLLIGFTLEGEQPKDKLKNKKIFVAPFMPGVGFSAEW